MYKGNDRQLIVLGRRGKSDGIVSMRRLLGLAVELDQGTSPTKTLGSITSPGATTVDESTSVYEAIDLMVKNGLGAVIVTAGSKPNGIFTERDVLKRVAVKDINTKKTAIKELMTSPLITMASTDIVRDVLVEMYRRDIRNMPVGGDNGDNNGVV